MFLLFLLPFSIPRPASIRLRCFFFFFSRFLSLDLLLSLDLDLLLFLFFSTGCFEGAIDSRKDIMLSTSSLFFSTTLGGGFAFFSLTSSGRARKGSCWAKYPNFPPRLPSPAPTFTRHHVLDDS